MKTLFMYTSMKAYLYGTLYTTSIASDLPIAERTLSLPSDVRLAPAAASRQSMMSSVDVRSVISAAIVCVCVYIYIYIYIYMYVCMYVCMYVYLCMYVCVYADVRFAPAAANRYSMMYICVRLCIIHVSTCANKRQKTPRKHTTMHTHTYIWAYTHTHTHTHTL